MTPEERGNGLWGRDNERQWWGGPSGTEGMAAREWRCLLSEGSAVNVQTRSTKGGPVLLLGLGGGDGGRAGSAATHSATAGVS